MFCVRGQNEVLEGDGGFLSWLACFSFIPSCTLCINHRRSLCIKPCIHYKGWICRIYHRNGSHCNLGQEDTGGYCETGREKDPRPCRLMDLERSKVEGYHQACYWDFSVIL